MGDPASPLMSLSEAVAVLQRLQQAAPSTTANRLSQVIALLESLAQENDYFSSLINEMENAPTNGNTSPVSSQSGLDEAALLVGVSTALRPPLNALRSRVDLLQSHQGFSEAQQDQLHGLQRHADRAFHVLDATEKLLVLQQGQIQLTVDAFIPTDLLREAEARLGAFASQHQHQLIVQMPETIPLCQGDFYQSLIILTGLLDNAIRYTPQGGNIRLSVDNLGTHVLFNVADTGIGLHAEDIPHVGQAFWRDAQNSLVKAHHGTGLTLYLARHILALQGGELIFFGQVGQGSTFSFTLPLVS